MGGTRLMPAAFAAALLGVSSGCLFAPKTQLNEALAQSRALSEQNRAQLVEIENGRSHSREAENRLVRAEDELAAAHDRLGLDRTQLASYQRETEALHEQFRAVAGHGGRARVAGQTARRLAELAQRHPRLRFDPDSGIGKLDTDILFESGGVELTPAAKQMVVELVRAIKSPEAKELRVMVVGHTDDRQVAGKAVREQYANNFHLSTARAMAVADLMRQEGLPEQRVGVAGMGAHQPLAPNATAKDRQKNRRVEIFVMPADVPIVGWVDSTPTLY